jgi:DNA polymerase-3 subunit alpha (Gram-positive type)
MQRDQSEVEKIAKYYDFIEVQPPKLYQDLIDRELIREIIHLHHKLFQLVCLHGIHLIMNVEF